MPVSVQNGVFQQVVDEFYPAAERQVCCARNSRSGLMHGIQKPRISAMQSRQALLT